MSISRQLAAIMFTDIVDYTTLMSEDENSALKLLHENRQMQKNLIEKFNGKWIKELGDGVLASFNSVNNSVNCAKEIIKACQQVENLSLRIGIHQGEIVIENDDVFGADVNIASHIQASILISEVVQKIIANQKDIKTSYFKDEVLKHLKQPIRLYEVLTRDWVNNIDKEVIVQPKKIADLDRNVSIKDNNGREYKALDIEYTSNGTPNIDFGKEDTEFVVDWSLNSPGNIWIYNQRHDTIIIGMIEDKYEFIDFEKLILYRKDIPMQNVISKGTYLIMKNKFNNIALLKFLDIEFIGDSKGILKTKYIII